jgi:hypothetical protein
MTDDERRAVIRSMLLLELNNVFSNAYRHIAHNGHPHDREYLLDLIHMLKECLKEEPLARREETD